MQSKMKLNPAKQSATTQTTGKSRNLLDRPGIILSSAENSAMTEN